MINFRDLISEHSIDFMSIQNLSQKNIEQKELNLNKASLQLKAITSHSESMTIMALEKFIHRNSQEI